MTSKKQRKKRERGDKFVRRLYSSLCEYLEHVAEKDLEAGREPMRFDNTGYGPANRGTQTGRFAILRVNVGLDNKRLLSLLDKPTLYQIVPWDTGDQPVQVYLDRQWVAIEAPLPEEAQEYDIQLGELTDSKHGHKVFVLGPNRAGVTVSLHLDDIIHVLIGGETGAGKTYAMRSIVYQLANEKVETVLIDGKRGDGLGILDGVPGQVGPLATEPREVKDALSWVYAQMMERYEAVKERGGRAWRPKNRPKPILAFFDEFQRFKDNDEIMHLMHEIASMGRSAGCHLIAGTQKPTVRMFGSGGGATRDQFSTRIALAVRSYQASEAIIGSNTPRADYLLPPGDAYVVGTVDGAPLRDRVQLAYVPEEELFEYSRDGSPDLARWPEFEVEPGGKGNGRGRPRMRFSERQIAISILGACEGLGRNLLQELLASAGERVRGHEPLDRLKRRGQRLSGYLEEYDEMKKRVLSKYEQS